MKANAYPGFAGLAQTRTKNLFKLGKLMKLHYRFGQHIKTAAIGTLALSVALACGSAGAQSNETQLLKRLDDLATELERVKAELKQMKAKQDAAPAPVAAAVPVGSSSTGVSPSPTSSPTSAPTQLTAYGEINYTRPRRDSAATQADVARLVLGFQHQFNERTKVIAELETEHAVTSSTDNGEVAVEQAYVEHRLNETFGARAGLFLMPLGLINQNHEPHTFYGVNRPTTETAIIPSTLREVGVQVFGGHDNGISWSTGLSTGPDLTKWDPTDAEGAESPFRALHQEGQLAKSKDLTLFGSMDWRGVPGLRLGGGFAAGKLGHGTKGFAAQNARYALWDVHAKWTPGPWDFSAVYAKGTISGAGDLNRTFSSAPYLVPKSFDGYYVQAAYRQRLSGDYVISPFARIERVNTGRRFDGVVQGFNVNSYDTETISTFGLNFNVAPAVVLKADFQRFKVVKDSDRLNLGLGFSF
jgi:hypothetical protein